MGTAEKSSSEATDAKTIQWLLEDDQPVAQYETLVDLLGRKESDAQVRRARSRIPRVGWAADQLRQQGPKGFWEAHEPRNLKGYFDFLYYPKYLSTNWRALVLSDFHVDPADPRIKKLAETLFRYKLSLSSPLNFYHEEMCASANTARMLTRFGYADDFRVQKLFNWLIEDQRKDGGWNCSQGTPGTLDVWEPLAAFAALPKSKRSGKMNEAIDRGAEFYLKRRLLKEGPNYPPWLRLHYPNHYYYDILVGLDLMTQLGYGGDRRLQPALDILRRKRQRNGAWRMDKLHPDVAPPADVAQYRKNVKPLVIEPAGQPSKMITLRALRVLKRVEEAS